MTIKHFIVQQMHKYIIRRYNKIIKYLKVLQHVSDHKIIHHHGSLYRTWLKFL